MCFNLAQLSSTCSVSVDIIMQFSIIFVLCSFSSKFQHVRFVVIKNLTVLYKVDSWHCSRWCTHENFFVPLKSLCEIITATLCDKLRSLFYFAIHLGHNLKLRIGPYRPIWAYILAMFRLVQICKRGDIASPAIFTCRKSFVVVSITSTPACRCCRRFRRRINYTACLQVDCRMLPFTPMARCVTTVQKSLSQKTALN